MSDHFEDSLQKRFELANRISEAKYTLLAIAIHGLGVLKDEGNKIALLTLEEMANSIPDDLEMAVASDVEKLLNGDQEE